MSQKRLIVGLGNPGAEYQLTRHNAGFMVAEALAKRADATWKFQSACQADLAVTAEAIYAKPQTYMNQSGQSVRAVLDYYQLPVDRLVVISDDVDLPFGELRARPGGGAGGHKGLTDIITHLKTEDFARLRIGVGRGPGTTTDHVLGRFTPVEQEQWPDVSQRAIEQLEQHGE